MSIDYFVYLKKTDSLSASTFEQYCEGLGLKISFHPGFQMSTDFGFVPMRFISSRFSDSEECFLTGFEYSVSEYRHSMPVPEKPKGFLRKLFPPKPREETPFDKAIQDATHVISLSCGSSDSFEILMAYVFGAYLTAFCDGVFDDPQTGQFYSSAKQMEIEIAAMLDELSQEAAKGELQTHVFHEWT